MIIPEKEFSGLSVMTAGDLIQIPLVRLRLIFFPFSPKDSIKHLLGLQLWHLFIYTELTEPEGKMINCLSTCLIKFEMVTFMMT